MGKRCVWVVGLLVVVCGPACSDGIELAGPRGGEMIDGERVHLEPFADGNTFACATCHALEEPAPDGFRRPGHPIGDATHRPHYKDGQLTELRAAVNTCVTEWMRATPLLADDPRWVALEAFLEGHAPAGEAPPVDIQIVDPPSDEDLMGGDVAAGRMRFNGSCAVCHGEDAVGTERAPPLVGKIIDRHLIAMRVRRSGRADSRTYTGLTGGVMPFWGADRLSDAELIDVAAFVNDQSIRSVPDAGLPDGGVSDAGDADASRVDAGNGLVDGGPIMGSCEATHGSVGQTATLATYFHDVRGDAEIIDDCTIVIRNFFYDGTGIDVKIYGGLGGDYRNGFPISDELVRAQPYAGETLVLTFAPGDLDRLDGISVWCVAARVSFGDGFFQ